MSIRQTIRFCHSADGTRIAVAECGEGPVLLRAAHWLSHCQHDPESPVWRPWLEALSSRYRYVRYDPRGCGLSDRNVTDLSPERWLADLEAVAATIPAPRFAVLGLSQGGSLAIRYAIDHPDRVSHLILVNCYAQGRLVRARTDAERLEAETLVNFIRVGWGRDNPAFCQFFTNLFIPNGTDEQHRWWGELERITAAPEVAADLLWHMQRIDVLPMLSRVAVPTLVLHSRGDLRVAFEEGCRLAAEIPGARFVPLEGENHVLLPDEPAWAVMHREIAEFLGSDGALRGKAPGEGANVRPAAQGHGSTHGPGRTRFPFGRAWLDLEAARLTDADGREIPLTAMEYNLLKLFAKNRGRVLNRDQILEGAHDRSWDPFDRSIDIRISRIRRKIELNPQKPEVIRTVRGVGYIYDPG